MNEFNRERAALLYNPKIVRAMYGINDEPVDVVLLREVVGHFEEQGASAGAAVHAVYEICRSSTEYGWRNPRQAANMDPAAAVGLRADSITALVADIRSGELELPTIRRSGLEVNCLQSLSELLYLPSS